MKEERATTTEEGDPYLALAKEVRDKILAMVNEAEGGGDLGCLINCAEDNTTLGECLAALECLRSAARLLERVIAKAEDGVPAHA